MLCLKQVEVLSRETDWGLGVGLGLNTNMADKISQTTGVPKDDSFSCLQGLQWYPLFISDIVLSPFCPNSLGEDLCSFISLFKEPSFHYIAFPPFGFFISLISFLLHSLCFICCFVLTSKISQFSIFLLFNYVHLSLLFSSKSGLAIAHNIWYALFSLSSVHNIFQIPLGFLLWSMGCLEMCYILPKYLRIFKYLFYCCSSA